MFNNNNFFSGDCKVLLFKKKKLSENLCDLAIRLIITAASMIFEKRFIFLMM